MKHLESFIPSRVTLPFILVMLANLLAAGITQAEPLTEDKIQSFIDAQESLPDFDAKYPGLDAATDELLDMARPVSSAMPALQQFPEVRKNLEETVTKHGFDSIEEWAEVGDRVYLAQFAISMQDMSAEERAMSEQMMSADHLEEMPEHMRERMRAMAAQSRQMMAAVENVPQEDIEKVRPFMSQLDPEEYPES